MHHSLEGEERESVRQPLWERLRAALPPLQSTAYQQLPLAQRQAVEALWEWGSSLGERRHRSGAPSGETPALKQQHAADISPAGDQALTARGGADEQSAEQPSISELLRDCTPSVFPRDVRPEASTPLPWQAPAGLPPGSRYEDLGLLGAGGMGQVRRVYDRDLNRIVAMKIINARSHERSSRRAQFLQEAQTTARLQHPNIPPVHDLGFLPDGRLYFTMREIKGRSLASVIQRFHCEKAAADQLSLAPRSEWDLRRLLAYLVQVCDAVSYAHSEGVLHRDIKPENILLGLHGEVLLIDWGITKWFRAPPPTHQPSTVDPLERALRPRSGAHLRGEAWQRELPDGRPPAARRETEQSTASRAAETAVTGSLDELRRSMESGSEQSEICGSPPYMAPEQISPALSPLRETIDVYGLGGCLYELLTGRPPFSKPKSQGRQPTAEERLTYRQRLSWPEAAELAPSSLRPIIARALCFEPEGRYESAAALGAALRGWLARSAPEPLPSAHPANARAEVPGGPPSG